jgi:hypothetical protein
MNPLAKRKETARAKQYLLDNPYCAYEQLIKALGIQSLSKPYFFNIRGTLRRQGKIPTLASPKNESAGKKPTGTRAGGNILKSRKFEIIHSMDASALTLELRAFWKSNVLPLLQKHIPGGQNIQFAFLADPPLLEIRKEIS